MGLAAVLVWFFGLAAVGHVGQVPLHIRACCLGRDSRAGRPVMCSRVAQRVLRITPIHKLKKTKEGSENSGHNLGAARIIEGHDNGQMLVVCTTCGCTAVSLVGWLGNG